MLEKERTDEIYNRKTHLYCLLILGVFFLIFKGTEGYKLYRYIDQTDTVRKYLYMTFTIFSSSSVPLILTVVGTTLLQKKDNGRKI